MTTPDLSALAQGFRDAADDALLDSQRPGCDPDYGFFCRGQASAFRICAERLAPPPAFAVPTPAEEALAEDDGLVDVREPAS